MAFVVKVPLNSRYSDCRPHNNLLNPFSELRVEKSVGTSLKFRAPIGRRLMVSVASNQVQSVDVAPTVEPKNVGIPIMVDFELLDFLTSCSMSFHAPILVGDNCLLCSYCN